MKVLLDQNLSAHAAVLLRERGIDAVHTRDVGLSTSADREILEWSRSENRVVITLDADFHAILAFQDSGAPSVVRIRIDKLSDVALAHLIEHVLERFHQELDQGAAISVDERSVRLRLLPLTSRDSGV